MGGYFSQLRISDPPVAAQNSKPRGDVIDISVHSCSNHPDREEEDRNADAFSVMKGILIDEGQMEGQEAATSAGMEALGSGELRTSSVEASSQIARALEESRGQSARAEGWNMSAGPANESAHPRRSATRSEYGLNGIGEGEEACRARMDAASHDAPAGAPKMLLGHLRDYFLRMRGGLEGPGKIPGLLDMARGWVGAFCSILIIAALKTWVTPESHLDFLVASFGASAVLVFGACEGKLAQPRNLVGGQVVSAIVGVTVRHILKDVIWLSSAVGMAVSLSVMQLLRCLHPPGGATALIAASVPNPLPIWAGYSIVLVVLIDSLIMLIVGLLVNNSWRGKRYPTYWW